MRIAGVSPVFRTNGSCHGDLLNSGSVKERGAGVAGCHAAPALRTGLQSCSHPTSPTPCFDGPFEIEVREGESPSQLRRGSQRPPVFSDLGGGDLQESACSRTHVHDVLQRKDTARAAKGRPEPSLWLRSHRVRSGGASHVKGLLGPLTGDSAPAALIGSWPHRRPLPGMYQNSRLPAGQWVFSMTVEAQGASSTGSGMPEPSQDPGSQTAAQGQPRSLSKLS